MVGRSISHYEILEELGEGGMGVVYRARDTRLGRIIALKILPAEALTKADRKLRFIQEARTASALNHPNIVTIHEIDAWDGTDFIAMEYVAGKTLGAWIGRKGLKIGDVLKLSVQISGAIAAAHAAGIIHRDLKPSSIMVTENGVAKVLDFGLAKLSERASGDPDAVETEAMEDKPKTEEGLIVGTVAYMSPEQAEGKKVDARSDIFSFGALLYEMTTGRRAFQGGSKLATLSAILREEPRPAGQIIESVPHELDRIIARCLRKDPVRRFQTMADLKVALEELKEESDSGSRARTPGAAPARSVRLALVLGLIAVVGAGISGIGVWFLTSRDKAPESTLSAIPLTTYAGFQGEPSFSPEGSQVAFSWDGDKRDNVDIYVQVVGAPGRPLRLTTDPAPDHNPAWSPDGRFIAFVRRTKEKSNVLLIPALGGPERKIAEAPSVLNLAWSPDGSSLVIASRDSPLAPFGLFLVSTETGESRRLTSPPAQTFGDHSPAFSSDGRSLAFTRGISLEVSDLYLLAFSDGLNTPGVLRRITFENHATNPAWMPDGREIVFSSAPMLPRSTGLWRITTAGQASKPRKLLSLGEDLFNPAISRNGRRLAYVHGFAHTSIWRMGVPGNRVRLDSSTVEPVRRGHAFISSTRSESQAQFSPDGHRIAFISERSGNEEIWLCGSDGSSAVQLTSFGGPGLTTPRWSPDGDRIAFDSVASGKIDIWTVSARGGKPVRVTTDSSNNSNPSWSRDGRWIYFDSSRSGEQQVWKIPATGGQAIQLTWDGGWAPVESPDRRYLYYLTNNTDRNTLWRIPSSGGNAAKVLDDVSDWNVALADSGIYFGRMSGSEGPAIQFLSFATNQVRRIVRVATPIGGIGESNIALSPDGQWLLYTQRDQAGSELMLVENFH